MTYNPEIDNDLFDYEEPEHVTSGTSLEFYGHPLLMDDGNLPNLVLVNDPKHPAYRAVRDPKTRVEKSNLGHFILQYRPPTDTPTPKDWEDSAFPLGNAAYIIPAAYFVSYNPNVRGKAGEMGGRSYATWEDGQTTTHCSSRNGIVPDAKFLGKTIEDTRTGALHTIGLTAHQELVTETLKVGAMRDTVTGEPAPLTLPLICPSCPLGQWYQDNNGKARPPLCSQRFSGIVIVWLPDENKLVPAIFTGASKSAHAAWSGVSVRPGVKSSYAQRVVDEQGNAQSRTIPGIRFWMKENGKTKDGIATYPCYPEGKPTRQNPTPPVQPLVLYSDFNNNGTYASRIPVIDTQETIDPEDINYLPKELIGDLVNLLHQIHGVFPVSNASTVGATLQDFYTGLVYLGNYANKVNETMMLGNGEQEVSQLPSGDNDEIIF